MELRMIFDIYYFYYYAGENITLTVVFRTYKTVTRHHKIPDISKSPIKICDLWVTVGEWSERSRVPAMRMLCFANTARYLLSLIRDR